MSILLAFFRSAAHTRARKPLGDIAFLLLARPADVAISSHFSLMIFSGNYAKMEVHNGSQNSAVYCGFRLPFFDFI